MAKKEQPNPGSDEALKKGCTCAVLDNRHGKGAFDRKDGEFWISENCPLHGIPTPKTIKPTEKAIEIQGRGEHYGLPPEAIKGGQ